MDRREFRRKLTSLILPITFQQFMLAVVSASDALMVGAIGQDLLSAVSLASQITFVYNLFLMAMTIGTSMFAAQYWGKGDKDAVERILGIVLRSSMSVSFVFFFAATFFPGLLMRIFTTDPQLIHYGVQYLQIVGLTYLLCGISQVYLCIMKNSGLASMSMLISSAAALLNIILNAVLIYGLFGAPRMEAGGAAAATAIARGVELLWVLAELTKKGRIKIRFAYIRRPDQGLRKDFWHYTLPVQGNELVWGGDFTMYSVIMGHLGTDAVAANSIANIAKNLIASLAGGIGNGGSIMVGNELGAGRLETAKAYGRKLCHIAVVSGIPIRISICFSASGTGNYGSVSSGRRVSAVDAGNVCSIHGRKICEWNYHRRNFLCRRRLQIRLLMRRSDSLVFYRSCRTAGCLCL